MAHVRAASALSGRRVCSATRAVMICARQNMNGKQPIYANTDKLEQHMYKSSVNKTLEFNSEGFAAGGGAHLRAWIRILF